MSDDAKIFSKAFEILHECDFYSESMFAPVYKGDALRIRWRHCQSTVTYYTALYGDAAPDDQEGKFFVLADYLTYIPYSEEGYRQFSALTNSMCAMAAAEWRMQKLERLMGFDFALLSGSAEKRIAEFFDNFDKDTLYPAKSVDALTAICRLHHRLDDVSRLGRAPIAQDETLYVYSIADRIAKMPCIYMPDLLSELPAPEPLSPLKLDYLSQMIDIENREIERSARLRPFHCQKYKTPI